MLDVFAADLTSFQIGIKIFSSYCSENSIKRGIDILVGTPGRIKDHLDRKNLVLSKLKLVSLIFSRSYNISYPLAAACQYF